MIVRENCGEGRHARPGGVTLNGALMVMSFQQTPTSTPSPARAPKVSVQLRSIKLQVLNLFQQSSPRYILPIPRIVSLQIPLRCLRVHTLLWRLRPSLTSDWSLAFHAFFRLIRHSSLIQPVKSFSLRPQLALPRPLPKNNNKQQH